ncbi:hypothetical protein HDU67_007780 [Dinochytrium kinnereticum]|nr:hypothetical protein HDU67_007780 [Dinochytrium kinnereticum]
MASPQEDNLPSTDALNIDDASVAVATTAKGHIPLDPSPTATINEAMDDNADMEVLDAPPPFIDDTASSTSSSDQPATAIAVPLDDGPNPWQEDTASQGSSNNPESHDSIALPSDQLSLGFGDDDEAAAVVMITSRVIRKPSVASLEGVADRSNVDDGGDGAGAAIRESTASTAFHGPSTAPSARPSVSEAPLKSLPKVDHTSKEKALRVAPPNLTAFPTTPRRISLPSAILASEESTSKSDHIHRIQNTLTDSQKIAYVGLCYLLAIHDELTPKLPATSAALHSHEIWFDAHMERLYASLDLSSEERAMIRQLVEHGVKPEDVARTLVQDAERATALADQDTPAQAPITPLLDVRYTILTHLFLLNLMDGQYDARSRTLLRNLSVHLGVPFVRDVVDLERAVAERIRVTDDLGIVEHSGVAVTERNRRDLRGRWLALGVATLAGGAVVGVTAGLAAPLIATGIGAALTMAGVSGGVGVGAFMGGTTGIAIIATSGAVTGGGMSGFKMLRRTRGISEFEFRSLTDALLSIESNAKKRVEEKQRRRSRRAKWKRLNEDGPSNPLATSGLKKEEEEEDPPALGVPVVDVKLESNPEVGRSRASTLTHREYGAGTSDAGTAEVFHDLVDLEGKPVNSPGRNAGLLKGDEDKDKVEGMGGVKASGSLIWERSRQGSESAVGESAVGRDEELVTTSSDEARDTSDCFSDGAWNPSDNPTGPPDFSKESIHNHALPPSAIEATTQPPKEAPLPSPKQLNVLITVAGWVTTRNPEDDFTLPFSTLTPGVHGDQYALVWETNALRELGSAMKMLVGEVTGFLIQQGIQTFLLPALMAGLTGPLWMLKLSGWLDNPWAVGLVKAKKAGNVLADTLMSNVQEGRPVTLIGFSLGARVIYYCLLELQKRGGHGLIEEVYLFGCPVISNAKEWKLISSVVSGRIVNGYLTNDWILGVLYRTSSAAAWRDVPGLRPVLNVDGVENVCLDGIVQGHLEYRAGLPKVLKHCGFLVDKEEFEEEEEEEVALGKGEEGTVRSENLPSKPSLSPQPAGVEKAVEIQKPVEKEPKKKSFWFFGRRKETAPVAQSECTVPSSAAKNSSENPLSTPEEDASEAENIKTIMEKYWEPREIVSTLPPLVIRPTEPEATNIPLLPPPPIWSPHVDKPTTAVQVEEKIEEASLRPFKRQGSNESLGDIGTTPHALSAFKPALDIITSPPLKHIDPLAPYPSPATVSTAVKEEVPDGIDTRKRDGPVVRWDGYQGPVISASSSSSDIATGADMVSSMGALPILNARRAEEEKSMERGESEIGLLGAVEVEMEDI